MQNKFSVLMVCTGNICRSPFAEFALLQQLQDIPEVEVGSAGIRAMVGESMFADTQKVAGSYGVEGFEGHRARQVSKELLEASDLILTMTREQRRAVVEISPRVTRRAFTIREFARLADATTDFDLHNRDDSNDELRANALRRAVQSVKLSRSLATPLLSSAEDEVVDPYQQSLDVHRTSAEQLIPAVESVALLIRRVISGGGV